MRPIEKRIAAVEARTLPRDSASIPLVLCPAHVDPAALRARKMAELGHSRFRMVRFVASDGTGGVKARAFPRTAH